MSSSHPPHLIQLRRQDLTPVARGWAEFIIHSMIPTGNKSEITVARAVLIHSIIKGHDVRVEELIADNIAVLAEGVQGRSKLCFPSTIYRLCKEAGVPMGEFKNSDQIQIARPITAKALRTRQDEMVNQQNNFYRQIKREQEKTIKEIEEVKKFQVNQTLMGARRTPEENLEEKMHETRNEIIEMRKQIRKWTINASSREGYCCWANQQANPNLVEIPPHKIPDFLHSNVANKKDPYFGALKSDLQQGESSQDADQTTQNPPNPLNQGCLVLFLSFPSVRYNIVAVFASFFLFLCYLALMKRTCLIKLNYE
ncbi:hypothetical protein PIB30_048833 [Stylosanthes scabra]|uniref:Putative plant transposon protein domain-containing protein n=1 Tax=Stylosanthes scabra TaxID=79078 RepID=A0ABU6TJ44_9FABA|nr:hypothetical protein [Stylosanthes scabra]